MTPIQHSPAANTADSLRPINKLAMLRFLQIVATVLSLAACVLAIVLWGRSYRTSDRVIGPLVRLHMFQAYTWQGTCHLMVSGPAYRLDLWEYYSSPVPQQADTAGMPARSPAFLGFSIQELSGVVHITAPMWFIVAGFGAIALALCHKHVKRRFSLRTLLIVMTLVSVVLAIIAASS